MKAFNAAAAVVIGIATMCSALPAQATSFPQSLREQRFVRSIGVTPGTQVFYLNATGQRVSFRQFKREADASGIYKIAKQGAHDEITVMQVATQDAAKDS